MKRFQLARFRKDHNMSQKDLAEKLSITQGFLSSIENGRSPLPVGKLNKLFEIFDVDNIDDYYVDDEEAIDAPEDSNSPIPTTSGLTPIQIIDSMLDVNSSKVVTKLIEVIRENIGNSVKTAFDSEQVVAEKDKEIKQLNRDIREAEERAQKFREEADQWREKFYTLREREFAYKELLMQNNITLPKFE